MLKRWIGRAAGLALALSSATCQDAQPAAPGGSRSDDDECEEGSRGCPCYRNSTCDEGLQCVDSLCVRLASEGEDGGAVSASGGASGAGALDGTGGIRGSAGDEPVGSGGTQVVLPEPAPGAPIIISLGSNRSVMGPGDTLTISALVTDPDGIDDLIGGTLLDAETGATYGALASAAAEGAYEISLPLSTINAAHRVDTLSGGGERTFLARFSDVAGNLTTGELTISFRCETETDALCDGKCDDLQTGPPHCGECYLECIDICGEGRCYQRVTSEVPATCDSICAAEGLSCSPRMPEGAAQPDAGSAHYANSNGVGFYRNIASCTEVAAAEATQEGSSTPNPHRSTECYCIDGDVPAPDPTSSMGGGGATSSPPTGGAAGMPSTPSPLVEDFASCDGDIPVVDGRDGAWYAFADTGITLTPDPFMVGAPPSPFVASSCAAWFSGSCTATPCDYAGLGFTLRADESPFDASAFQGLSFGYQGTELYVVMHSSTGTFGVYIPASPSARTTRSFSFFDLAVSGSTPATAVFNPRTLIKVEFTTTSPASFEQAVYDVRFLP